MDCRGATDLFLLGSLSLSLGLGLLLSLTFLEERLGNEDLVLGGDSAASMLAEKRDGCIRSNFFGHCVSMGAELEIGLHLLMDFSRRLGLESSHSGYQPSVCDFPSRDHTRI